jgi:hypothetical protein
MNLGRALNTISTRMFPNVLPQDPARLNRSADFYGFDRQFIRASLVLDILRNIGCDAFIETGAQNGATAWLVASQRRVPIFVAAETPDAYRRARSLLGFYRRQVHVRQQDVRTFLNQLIADARLPFVYLNHSADAAVLHEELKLVGRLFRQYVVMVDDFKLEPAAIAEDLTAMGGVMYAPAYDRDLETGAQYGFALIVPRSLTDKFDETYASYLKRAP